MKNINFPVLILDLANGDGGFVKYADEVLNGFSSIKGFHFCSKYRLRSKDHKGFKTFRLRCYRSVKDIVPKTLIFLPVYVFLALWLILFNGVRCLYLPYFNHWNIFFAVLFRVFGLRVIYTAHDGKLHLGEKSMVTQKEMNLNIQLASVVIFLSKSSKNEVREILGGKSSEIIPLGVFSFEGVQPLDVAKKNPTLLFLGRISKYKGIELLLEALTEVPPEIFYKCIIAGKSNYDVPWVLNDKIEVHDRWLSEAEMADFINASDIMIFPYLEATQSGPLTLAISSARPIICTNVGGLVEQVDSNEALFVLPNKKSLVEGIVRICMDHSLRNKLIGALAKKNEELQWANISSRIEKVIKG